MIEDTAYPQASLLSRLQSGDADGKKRNRSFSVKEYRLEIIDNIELILNSHSHPGYAELGDRPLVKASVLALGLTDFCGKSHSAECLESLRLQIKEQLTLFEPRLNPDSITVKFKQSDLGKGVFSLEILGVIGAYAQYGKLECRLLLDFESGSTSVL